MKRVSKRCDRCKTKKITQVVKVPIDSFGVTTQYDYMDLCHECLANALEYLFVEYKISYAITKKWFKDIEKGV